MKKSFLSFIIITSFVFLGACSDDNHGDGGGGPEILGLMDGNGGMVEEVREGDSLTVVTTDDCKIEDGCTVHIDGDEAEIDESVDLSLDEVKDVKAGKDLKKSKKTVFAKALKYDSAMLVGANDEDDDLVKCDWENCDGWCMDACEDASIDEDYDACVDECNENICSKIDEDAVRSAKDIDKCDFAKITKKTKKEKTKAEKTFDKEHVTVPLLRMPQASCGKSGTTTLSLTLKYGKNQNHESKPYEVNYICNRRKVISIPGYSFLSCQTNNDCQNGQICKTMQRGANKVCQGDFNPQGIVENIRRLQNLRRQ
ncbi:MAG TPA: hypothetical protein DDW49_08240 [Deltaproteobacteria bacterium]|nr:MAG: hypothetical protein A2048_07855 [Deltaproteobacteria bacterium GWA2_45_12]HBF13353.1 hypothetical protein [Deltaproteobacteria bacterium]